MAQCDTCMYKEYDEEAGEDICVMELDEDEYERFCKNTGKDCPYYRFYDEYLTVRKQN